MVKSTSRKVIPHMLNDMGLTNEGAEIGVWRGEHAEMLLTEWKGRLIHFIDPWEFFKYEKDGVDITDSTNQDKKTIADARRRAFDKIGCFPESSRIYVGTSADIAPSFETDQLDFAYIDGRHFYDGIMEDLRLWYPKVRKGGLVCGHDHKMSSNKHVPMALIDFFDSLSYDPELQVFQTGKDPTWAFVKA